MVVTWSFGSWVHMSYSRARALHLARPVVRPAGGTFDPGKHGCEEGNVAAHMVKCLRYASTLGWPALSSS